MKISQLITEKNIMFLKEDSREKVLKALIDSADKNGYLTDKLGFMDAILDRENTVGTGIGCKLAIPHAKVGNIEKFFIIAGILETPVDWDSIDGKPVKAAFLIGGPEDSQHEYLQLLSALTTFIKDEERREKLFSIKTKEDFLELISEF